MAAGCPPRLAPPKNQPLTQQLGAWQRWPWQRRDGGRTTVKRVAPQTHLDWRMVSLLTRRSQGRLRSCCWPQPPAIERHIQLQQHIPGPPGASGLCGLGTRAGLAGLSLRSLLGSRRLRLEVLQRHLQIALHHQQIQPLQPPQKIQHLREAALGSQQHGLPFEPFHGQRIGGGGAGLAEAAPLALAGVSGRDCWGS